MSHYTGYALNAVPYSNMLEPAGKAGIEKPSKIESHAVPYSELKEGKKKKKKK